MKFDYHARKARRVRCRVKCRLSRASDLDHPPQTAQAPRSAVDRKSCPRSSSTSPATTRPSAEIHSPRRAVDLILPSPIPKIDRDRSGMRHQRNQEHPRAHLLVAIHGRPVSMRLTDRPAVSVSIPSSPRPGSTSESRSPNAPRRQFQRIANSVNLVNCPVGSLSWQRQTISRADCVPAPRHGACHLNMQSARPAFDDFDLVTASALLRLSAPIVVVQRMARER